MKHILALRLSLYSLAGLSILGLAHMVFPSPPTISIIATLPGVAGLATDLNGYIYLPSRTGHTITILDASGVVLKTIGPQLSHGYKLHFPKYGFIPIHVDRQGRIYVYSLPHLFVLDADGNLLNAASDGKLPRGFRLPFVYWLATTETNEIYVYPPPTDETALITVFSPDGTYVRSFGDRVFTKRSGINIFHLAKDHNNTLYAFFSNFATMIKYSSEGRYLSAAHLRCPSSIEEEVAASNVSMEQALALDSFSPVLATAARFPVYLDAQVLNQDTLICLANTLQLLWYSLDGQLVKHLDLPSLIFQAAIPFTFLERIAVGPEGHCVFAIGPESNQVYKITLD